jgi:NlpC/P60 family putative phage cell wall peptidase
VIAGTSYEPDTGFAASEIRASADFSVDGQDAEGALRSDRITETDILDGRWDNAAIEVWRVNWENVAQRVLMRRGNLGQIRRGKQVFVAEVRSMTHFLNQPVGRTYQYYCDAELGDARCGVNLAAPSYSASGSVAAVSGDRSFTTAGLGGFALNWFALGRVEWTSGANAGRRAEVSIHAVSAGAAKITLIEAPVRDCGWRRVFHPGGLRQAVCDLWCQVRQWRELPRLSTNPGRRHHRALSDARRWQHGAASVNAAADLVIAAARGWLGTPYVHQASVLGAGCDCLGLARGIWRDLYGPEPVTPPPYTRDWGEAGGAEVLGEAARRFLLETPIAVAGPGALILFRMARGAPAKHCGIRSETSLIHAYEGAGVIEEPWSPIWARKAVFAFHYPE